MKIKSHAKINLSLYIFNKLKNNYHNLESVIHQIDLHDTISIKKIKQDKIIIKSNIKKLENKDNLAYKAASLLKNKYKIKDGFEIKINKKIPLQSGLGGGSSNAAATLKSINKLSNLKLNKKELINLALNIGSDVHFFIEGNTSLVSGIGNKIKKINSKLKLNLIIIKPELNISTKIAYDLLDNKRKNYIKKNTIKKLNNNKELIKLLKQKNIKKITENLHNDFESVIIKKYPIINEIKNDLMKNNALNSLMSGSGSSVFGIFKNKKEAEKAYKKLSKKFNSIYLTKSF